MGFAPVTPQVNVCGVPGGPRGPWVDLSHFGLWPRARRRERGDPIPPRLWPRRRGADASLSHLSHPSPRIQGPRPEGNRSLTTAGIPAAATRGSDSREENLNAPPRLSRGCRPGRRRGCPFPRLPCAHGHGRGSGQVRQPRAERPTLAVHSYARRSSSPEGQHPVAASSRQSALPCSPSPGRRALPAPPPPVNTAGPALRAGTRRCKCAVRVHAQPAARGLRCPPKRRPRGPHQAPGTRPGAGSARAGRSLR